MGAIEKPSWRTEWSNTSCVVSWRFTSESILLEEWDGFGCEEPTNISGIERLCFAASRFTVLLIAPACPARPSAKSPSRGGWNRLSRSRGLKRLLSLITALACPARSRSTLPSRGGWTRISRSRGLKKDCWAGRACRLISFSCHAVDSAT